MSTHAKRERLLLADLLESAGPDAPTLCEGWNTRDLAAHVVVRERRADAAGGLLIKPLAPRLERVQAEFAAKPYEELIQLIRTGPPRMSPFALKQVDEAANTVEFYVHAEDVRRAQPGLDSARAGPGLRGRPVVAPGAGGPDVRPQVAGRPGAAAPGRPDGGRPPRHTGGHRRSASPRSWRCSPSAGRRRRGVELDGDKDALARLARRASAFS